MRKNALLCRSRVSIHVPSDSSTFRTNVLYISDKCSLIFGRRLRYFRTFSQKFSDKCFLFFGLCAVPWSVPLDYSILFLCSCATPESAFSPLPKGDREVTGVASGCSIHMPSSFFFYTVLCSLYPRGCPIVVAQSGLGPGAQ